MLQILYNMKHLFTFLALISAAVVLAQPGAYVITNSNTAITSGLSKVHTDGSIVAVNTHGGKINITLFNNQLTKQWEKELNITNAPVFDPYFSNYGDINLTFSGNNIVLTYLVSMYDSISWNGLNYNYTVIMDMNGNVSSVKSFASDPNTTFYYSALSDAMKFVTDASGNIYKSESFYNKGRITKYLPNGNFSWQLDFGGDVGTGKNPTFDLECEGDSEIVVSGKEGSFLKVFTIRPNGTIKKAVAFQSNDYSYIHGKRIQRVADGSYLISGFAGEYSAFYGYTPIVVKLNKDMQPIKEITINLFQTDINAVPSLYDMIETDNYYYFAGAGSNKSFIVRMNKDFTNVKTFASPGDATIVSKVKQGEKEFFVFQAYSGWQELAIVDPTNLNGCGWIEINASVSSKTPSTIANELYFSNLVTQGPSLQNEQFTVTNSQSTTIYKTCSFELLSSDDNQALTDGFSVFPNPVQHEFTLKINTAFMGSDASVYDVMGRIVLSHKVISEFTPFDVANLAPGMYVIKVADSNGSILYQNKLIKAAN